MKSYTEKEAECLNTQPGNGIQVESTPSVAMEQGYPVLFGASFGHALMAQSNLNCVLPRLRRFVELVHTNGNWNIGQVEMAVRWLDEVSDHLDKIVEYGRTGRLTDLDEVTP